MNFNYLYFYSLFIEFQCPEKVLKNGLFSGSRRGSGEGVQKGWFRGFLSISRQMRLRFRKQFRNLARISGNRLSFSKSGLASGSVSGSGSSGRAGRKSAEGEIGERKRELRSKLRKSWRQGRVGKRREKKSQSWSQDRERGIRKWDSKARFGRKCDAEESK